MKKLKINRKRKFTNYFKIGILFVGISLFLSSCEKDNKDIEPIQEQNRNYLQKKVTINELQKNTKLINKISLIQNKLKTNTLAKGGKKAPSFNIYLKEATYIEDKTTNLHSYTFPVVYNNPDYKNDTIKNIVLALTQKNTYKAFLATYKVTKQERELIANGTSINLSEKLNMTSLNINQVNMLSRSECYWIQKFTREEIACSLDGCWDPQYTTWITVTEWDLICVDIGGDGNSTGNSDNSTGSGGSNNSTSVPTTPVIDGIEASISRINSAIGPLNFKEKIFLEDNVGALLSIEDFLFENNSTEANTFTNELLDIMSLESTVDQNLLEFNLKSYDSNKINNIFNSTFLQSTNNLTSIDFSKPENIDPWITYFTMKCAVLKSLNPSYSDTKVFWEASKEGIHISLDVFGMIPVVGEIADLTNGVLYTIEGDGVNATLSYASAIPVAGWAATATKFGLMVIKIPSKAAKVKLVWKISSGVVEFGNRAQLRKVLGMAAGNLDEAHHIIPWDLGSNPVVQKAAKNNFHLNFFENGIDLTKYSKSLGEGLHGNHPAYTDWVTKQLSEFAEDNYNTKEASDYLLNDLIPLLRKHIADADASGLNLNEYFKTL